MALELPQRVTDRIENFGKEDLCWRWTGQQTKSGVQLRMQRDYEMRPYKMPTKIKPYGVTKFEGKRTYVHKLVFEALANQTLQMVSYQIRNECGDTLCCNPRHWRIVDRSPPPEMLKPPAGQGQLDECVELLEDMLAHEQPQTLEEVRKHSYMVDFPEEVIRTALVKVGKGWLCTPSS
ncbi:hypothetical protein [Cupriavidus sp. DL-D2]|uniref:hypothetical protein n=1 Tax=Cupriavidus sp. DL-D2 TaxID=3144974 RepID=UPI0032150791